MPSGWLGIVLAGVVWTELREASFDSNCATIAGQIWALTDDVSKEESVSETVVYAQGLERETDQAKVNQELLEELTRLRSDMQASKGTANAPAAADDTSGDRAQLAPLAALVPELPVKDPRFFMSPVVLFRSVNSYRLLEDRGSFSEGSRPALTSKS